METLFEVLKDFKIPQPKKEKYKTFRQHLVTEITKDINLLRVGTKFKPITERTVALLVNKNPYLKGEANLKLLYEHCKKNRSFAKFFYMVKSEEVINT